MTIGSVASGNLPKGLTEFEGLWYMNGNPLSDECLSFSGAYLDQKNFGYALKVYDEDHWSWSPNQYGRALHFATRLAGLTYVISRKSADVYNILPIITDFPVPFPVPNMLVSFDLVRTADPDIWTRNSTIVGNELGSYSFQRIVFGNGTRTAKYASNYLPNIGNPKRIPHITLEKTQFVVKKMD